MKYREMVEEFLKGLAEIEYDADEKGFVAYVPIGCPRSEVHGLYDFLDSVGKYDVDFEQWLFEDFSVLVLMACEDE